MAKSKFSTSNPGKTYRVTKAAQTVGRWTHPQAFNEHQFEAAHPVPDTDAARSQVDAETYHSDLFHRLIVLGAIEEAPGATVSEVDVVGAHQQPNHAILASIGQHIRAEAAKAEIDGSDVAARTGAAAAVRPAAVPPPAVEAPQPAPVVTRTTVTK